RGYSELPHLKEAAAESQKNRRFVQRKARVFVFFFREPVCSTKSVGGNAEKECNFRKIFSIQLFTICLWCDIILTKP
ncbi:MAG: hypothetical protein K2P33_00540, partial [Acutalibacter sp.]|nr:hypothetical protein [Acutalibacter sp.]